MEIPVSSVSKQVSQALADDPRTSKAIIEVEYHQGVITLMGSVKSAAVIQVAEDIARAQPGVVSVQNELKVM